MGAFQKAVGWTHCVGYYIPTSTWHTNPCHSRTHKIELWHQTLCLWTDVWQQLPKNVVVSCETIRYWHHVTGWLLWFKLFTSLFGLALVLGRPVSQEVGTLTLTISLTSEWHGVCLWNYICLSQSNRKTVILLSNQSCARLLVNPYEQIWTKVFFFVCDCSQQFVPAICLRPTNLTINHVFLFLWCMVLSQHKQTHLQV